MREIRDNQVAGSRPTQKPVSRRKVGQEMPNNKILGSLTVELGRKERVCKTGKCNQREGRCEIRWTTSKRGVWGSTNEDGNP